MALFNGFSGKVSEAPVSVVSRRKASAVSRLVDTYLELEKKDLKFEKNCRVGRWRTIIYSAFEEKISSIDYTPDDLQKIVLAFLDLKTEKIVLRGTYLGGLVSKLTERYNERVIVELDFNGEDFSWACYATKYADVLKIKNVKGKNIASQTASYEGKVNLIEFEDINSSVFGIYLGSEHGKLPLVYFNNINSRLAGYNSGNNGYVGALVYDNCVGIAENRVGILTKRNFISNNSQISYNKHSLELIDELKKLKEKYLTEMFDLDSKVKELLAKVEREKKERGVLR